MPSPKTMASSLDVMASNTPVWPQKGGMSFGRMVVFFGFPWKTLRSQIPWRWQNVPLPIKWQRNQPLLGGFVRSWDVLDRIIKKVKSCYSLKTHKFGIELPKSVKQALEIDCWMGTDFWRQAIDKEMKNVMVAFEFCDDDVVPVGYRKIDCHMIFDFKMCLTQKAWFVARWHMTDPPKDATYSSVVLQDSVRIAFLTAALNDLDVLAADVQNGTRLWTNLYNCWDGVWCC